MTFEITSSDNIPLFVKFTRNESGRKPKTSAGKSVKKGVLKTKMQLLQKKCQENSKETVSGLEKSEKSVIFQRQTEVKG